MKEIWHILSKKKKTRSNNVGRLDTKISDIENSDAEYVSK